MTADRGQTIPPGSTIGILGGGQLGRMTALAAARLGYRVHSYCPEAGSPAFDVSAARTVAYELFEKLGYGAVAVTDTHQVLAFVGAGAGVMGLAFVRYVWKVEPIASMSDGEIVAAVAPNLQRFIDGDIATSRE